MKKFITLTTFVVILCMLATMACACSGKDSEETIADSVATEATTTEATTAAAAEPSVATTEGTSATTAEVAATTSASETTAATAAATTAAGATTGSFTDEMAIDAIQTHCVLQNTEFASLSGDHWQIISSTDSQVVVLFVSYTGSENRYYIDRATGDTHVTELVPGIIDEEQDTGERFNAKDFLAAEIYG